jgi:competence protein ComEC
MKRQLYYIPLHLFVGYSIGLSAVYCTEIHFSLYLSLFFFGTSLLLHRFFFQSIMLLWTIAFCWGLCIMQVYLLPRGAEKEGAKAYKLQILEPIHTNSYSCTYHATALSPLHTFYPETVEVRIENDSTNALLSDDLIPGDVILGRGVLKPLTNSKNPFGFDYKNYLSAQNIHRTVYLKVGQWKLLTSQPYSFKSRLYRLQQFLILRLQTTINAPDIAAFSLAFLLGERSYINPKIKADFSKVGLIHILAISGLHIGMLLLLLRFLCRPLSIFKHARALEFVIIVFSLLCYALLTGLSASVLRAVTMYIFVAIGILWKHQIPLLNALVASALLLVCIDPFCLFTVGFQMSYAAVFSIAIVQPILLRFWQPKQLLIQYFWKLTTVSVAAQLGVLPLSLYYFHQFSGVFLLSNVLVMPFVGLLFICGVIVLFVSVFNRSAPLIIDSYRFLVSQLHLLIDFLGENKMLFFEAVHFSKLLVVVSYLFLGALTALLYFKNIKTFRICCISILLLQGSCFLEKKEKIKLSKWVVFHQYKAILVVKSKHGTTNAWGEMSKRTQQNLKNYCVEIGHDIPVITKQIPQVFAHGDALVLRVDARGTYEVPYLKNPIVLLSNSPKINLERLLQLLCPVKIIADGSNKSFYRQKWAATCAAYGVEFHDTYTKGAFILH